MKNYRKSKLTFAAALLGMVFGSPGVFPGGQAHAAEMLWVGDFETGDFSQYVDHLYGGGTRSTKDIVKSPVRAGEYATELTILDFDADGTQRAELMTRMPNGGRIHFKWDGPEYWIGFSFLFKEEVAHAYTFFQIHAPNESKGDPCDFAGNTFSVWGDGAGSNGGMSKDIVVRIIENGGISRGKGAGSNNTVVHRYPFPINEWQDFVVNFRLSTRGDGFYKIWKNGEVIYDETGLTNVNFRDSCGNLIPEEERSHNGAHIGVYAPGGGYRRIFYDEVRVAKGSGGYNLVAPDGGDPSATPDPEPEDSVPNPPIIVRQ